MFVEAYRNREVYFKFRDRSYCFSLSQELFSSADIDTGSRFLLKVFSDSLDKDIPWRNLFPADGLSHREPSCWVLDSGCGAGVLGICAAGALSGFVPPSAFRVRAQDRDELARLFTEYNAERNGLSKDNFEAYTEPLLTGPPGKRWDLILTNIPAKAGRPVLEDFVHRSAGLLKQDGRVFLVAVNTLADFFRSQIAAACAPLLIEETGKEHTVFVYTARQESSGRAATVIEQSYGPLVFDENFPESYPFYVRNRSDYEMEDIAYHLDTVHGAADFDSPGGAVQAAAKLAVKIDLASKAATALPQGEAGALLIHDAGQGHFALWLAHYLNLSIESNDSGETGNSKRAGGSFKADDFRWVLSSRNIVALGAAKAALTAARAALARGKAAPDSSGASPSIVSVADIFLDRERLWEAAKSSNGFAFTAFFPEAVPEAEATWKGLTCLTASGGIAFAGMDSAEAERFDRKKPPGWHRMGDIKRKGFRALAYKKQ